MDTIKLETSTKLLRNTALFSSSVDNDLVMLDETAGLYFGLNSVGHKIWQLLETPLTYGLLLEQLLACYEVTLEQCQQDIERFLSSMFQHKLLAVVE